MACRDRERNQAQDAENGDAAEEVFEEGPDDDEAPLIPGSDGSLGIGSLRGMQR